MVHGGSHICNMKASIKQNYFKFNSIHIKFFFEFKPITSYANRAQNSYLNIQYVHI